ncbi:murein L,D-transpeptidase catalytic domain family protein [Flavobacterium sp. CBA20B-1]|uniref:murein L,D-transpeptidase catalytic domain family protein n=1 Tax=unclassified Flavobacterium TaxID=196869 RepID=UPI002225A37E|nr:MULTISPECIES: murein L,D-transpeptidase catalytic domain family protein [unclassified Flavobacterium]WCM41121.1 murein L,D-transpeptidase catalytic domain family protein [Flavobacterium sp. CBA20B-1]
MKKILIRSLFAIVLLAAVVLLVLKFVRPQYDVSTEANDRFKENTKIAKTFLQDHADYNQDIVFLADMAIKSRYNRFYVYDVKNDSVLHKGLVAHGKGSNTGTYGELQFSNVEGSNMTSLGNYKVGASYVGRFGKSYKLHGLDKTNDQAFARYVVLHTYAFMPHEEQLVPVINSEGCPMVSQETFKILENIIDNSKKHILLRIYYK